MIQVQPADVTRAFVAMDGHKNPVKAVGSLLGFSGDEIDAGVPKWAWFVLGTAAGAAALVIAKRQGLVRF